MAKPATIQPTVRKTRMTENSLAGFSFDKGDRIDQRQGGHIHQHVPKYIVEIAKIFGIGHEVHQASTHQVEDAQMPDEQATAMSPINSGAMMAPHD